LTIFFNREQINLCEQCDNGASGIIILLQASMHPQRLESRIPILKRTLLDIVMQMHSLTAQFLIVVVVMMDTRHVKTLITLENGVVKQLKALSDLFTS